MFSAQIVANGMQFGLDSGPSAKESLCLLSAGLRQCLENLATQVVHLLQTAIKPVFIARIVQNLQVEAFVIVMVPGSSYRRLLDSAFFDGPTP